jgi:methyl-accepting chemotaxis protein
VNLDSWLRNRLAWLVTPTVVGNSLAVAVAAPWAASLESLNEGSLQVFLLLTVGLTLGLQLTLSGAALSRLRSFRGLVSGRLPVTREHRLAALGELRRLPARMAGLSLGGWLLGALGLGLGMVALADAPWFAAFRLVMVGVLFGPLATVLVSLLITTRSHEACDRLSEGLPPHDVIAAAPGVDWSIRSRTVAFTILLTVIPVLIFADVAWVALGRAPAELATLPPETRQAAADALFWALAWRLAGLGLLSLGFAVVAASAAGQSIARPMQRLVGEARRVAGGDLDSPRVIAADGEVWRVTGVFGQLHERLAGLVRTVLDAGADVRKATESLQRTSQRSEATAAEQAAALNQTSATTEELARSARQIAASAGSVQELAQRTLEAAQQGQSDAAAFQAAVDRMKQDNRSIAGAVDRLQRRVQQIGRIVELINAVADRSDLLALSAELEGTRAGEVGRGFSLVGAEMRRLAENVLESTAEVEELIAEIRDATVRTAEATERGSTLTQRGTALAEEVTTSLSRVAQLALETSNQVRTITLTTQQQQSGTDQLAEAMADILSRTQAELATTHRVAEVNHRLLGLSNSLQGVVRRFTRAKRESDAGSGPGTRAEGEPTRLAAANWSDPGTRAEGEPTRLAAANWSDPGNRRS